MLRDSTIRWSGRSCSSSNAVRVSPSSPTIDATGHWTVELPALDPGSYRVFADFQPADDANLTLGTDITVPGEVPYVELPNASDVVTVDGYTVTMTGTPARGDSDLSFTVARDGQVVRTDPYLGAAGHLVAIPAATWPTCTCIQTKGRTCRR